MKQKANTYLCCLVMCAFGIILSIIGPLLTDISKSYNLTMSQTGLIFSINFLGFIIFVLIGGVMAERYGKKKLIAVAILGLSISLFMFSFSKIMVFAFVAIFLIGGFGGIIESIVSSLVADLNEVNTEFYINVSQIFLCLGATLGPVLALLVKISGGSWRTAYFILSIIMLILFIVFYFAKMTEKPTVNKMELTEFKMSLQDKKFIVILIAFILYTGTEVGVWGWMATFFETNMKQSSNISTILVSVFWVSMTVGRMICGKLIKYFSVKNIVVFLFGFSGIVIFISGFITGGILSWVIVIATGFAFSSIYPFLLSLGNQLRSNATAFALMVGFGGIGTILIPFFMGIIGDFYGTNIAMMSPSILMIITAVLIKTSVKKSKFLIN